MRGASRCFSSVKRQMVRDHLYGAEVVWAALKSNRRTSIGPLYIQEGKSMTQSSSRSKGKGNTLVQIMEMARSQSIATRTVTRHELNVLSDNRPHNGVVLAADSMGQLVESENLTSRDEIVIPDLEWFGEIASEECKLLRHPVWIAVDEVMDPQNLGAILRNAMFFGAYQVVICRKNCAPLSPVVSKASAGAMEFVNIRYCSSMPRFLKVHTQTSLSFLRFP